MARELEGYNQVTFPPSVCVLRKRRQTVIMVVRFANLLLKSPEDVSQRNHLEGKRSLELQENSMEIEWDRIEDFRICEEGTAFSFEYLRDSREENEEETEKKKTKYVRLETPFVSCRRTGYSETIGFRRNTCPNASKRFNSNDKPARTGRKS